ncbi:MAG: DUF1080 domain-containing protein [Verrucomicrobiales bacterium]|nr:DUF1080 domain-containing protein [Verrucomicrobiales bacterium]
MMHKPILRTPINCLTMAVFTLGFATVAVQADDSKAVSPTETVDLLADPAFTNFTTNVNPAQEPKDDPKDIWKMGDDGILKISGRGWGYIRTNQKYRDYHLVLEYTWGEKTWGTRVDRARDCGLLVHSYGKDGAYGGTWIASIESQLIEGGSGDILVLSPKDEKGVPAPTSLTSEYILDPNQQKIWKPGAEKQVVTGGRINWLNRDPKWEDKLDFRGEKEVENLPGEWNRMEIICKGGDIDIFLNGVKVNAGTDANPTEGYVCLQTEAAEMFVRRYELWPLDKFEEKWTEADKKPKK